MFLALALVYGPVLRSPVASDAGETASSPAPEGIDSGEQAGPDVVENGEVAGVADESREGAPTGQSGSDSVAAALTEPVAKDMKTSARAGDTGAVAEAAETVESAETDARSKETTADPKTAAGLIANSDNRVGEVEGVSNAARGFGTVEQGQSVVALTRLQPKHFVFNPSEPDIELTPAAGGFGLNEGEYRSDESETGNANVLANVPTVEARGNEVKSKAAASGTKRTVNTQVADVADIQPVELQLQLLQSAVEIQPQDTQVLAPTDVPLVESREQAAETVVLSDVNALETTTRSGQMDETADTARIEVETRAAQPSAEMNEQRQSESAEAVQGPGIEEAPAGSRQVVQAGASNEVSADAIETRDDVPSSQTDDSQGKTPDPAGIDSATQQASRTAAGSGASNRALDVGQDVSLPQADEVRQDESTPVQVKDSIDTASVPQPTAPATSASDASSGSTEIPETISTYQTAAIQQVESDGEPALGSQQPAGTGSSTESLGDTPATREALAAGEEGVAGTRESATTRVAASINAVTAIAGRMQRMQLLKSELRLAVSERDKKGVAAIIRKMQELLGSDSLYLLKARASAELSLGGDSGQVKSLLQAVLARDPGDKEARVNMAKVEINLGEIAAATGRLEALADEYPEDRRINELLDSIR